MELSQNSYEKKRTCPTMGMSQSRPAGPGGPLKPGFLKNKCKHIINFYLIILHYSLNIPFFTRWTWGTCIRWRKCERFLSLRSKFCIAYHHDHRDLVHLFVQEWQNLKWIFYNSEIHSVLKLFFSEVPGSPFWPASPGNPIEFAWWLMMQF